MIVSNPSKMTRKYSFAYQFSIASLILIMFLLAPNTASAKCIEDAELLTSVEFGENRACSEIGQIQLEYLKGNIGFAFGRDQLNVEYIDYTSSRLAFSHLNEELRLASKYATYRANLSGAFNLFQLSIITSVMDADFKRNRGALYFAAFVALANKFSTETSIGSVDIFDQFSQSDEMYFPLSGEALRQLSICFWEYDIPTIDVETVLNSDAVTACVNTDQYQLETMQ